MKLVILITAQVEEGLDIAQAWQEAGGGVTILPAHGLRNIQQELRSGSVELPQVVGSMGAAMAAILDSVEARSVILLSVVEDQGADALIAAANHLLGDLTQPDNGILFVLPIERAIGVRRYGGKA